jgi:hypothetical protein
MGPLTESRGGAYASFVSTTTDGGIGCAAEEITWVRVAGYALEKIHTGVLVHALTRGTPASDALAAALWKRVTGATVDPETLTDLQAKPEVSLGDGADSVIDLLVSFVTPGGRHWLGVEMKVDAPPRREQLEQLDRGVRAKPGVAHQTALLALGAAQVCRIERGAPAAILRLAVRDVLAWERELLAAGDPSIVGPWLRELAFEEARRASADALTESDAPQLGYRVRTLRAYQLAHLAEGLVEAGLKPWEVSIQSHNVIATATDSWRRLPGDGPAVTVYLELTDDGVCLKAGCWSGGRDPRAASDAITSRMMAALDVAKLEPMRGKRRQGQSATLCKVPVWGRPDVVERIGRVSALWEAEWEAYVASLSATKGTPPRAS